jgi:hypothetical protein
LARFFKQNTRAAGFHVFPSVNFAISLSNEIRSNGKNAENCVFGKNLLQNGEQYAIMLPVKINE